MTREVSAGGVIIRKSRGKWQILLLRDMNAVWTFPKGLIEKDEDPLIAAQREAKEEVGISKLRFLADFDKIHYFYHHNGLISKTVHYFLFLATGREKLKPQKEEGVSEARWFNLSDTLKIIGYAKTNLALLSAAEKYLCKQNKYAAC